VTGIEGKILNPGDRSQMGRWADGRSRGARLFGASGGCAATGVQVRRERGPEMK